MKRVFLVGMPASGKSVFGRHAAKKMNMEFLDMDTLIEEREGLTVAEVFSSKGEPYFRETETKLLAELAGSEPKRHPPNGLIVSTGGGIVEREQNRDILADVGGVIFLDRSLEDIRGNVKYGEKRPVLSDPQKLEELYLRRRPMYAAVSDQTVVNRGDFYRVLNRLVSAVQRMDSFAVIGDPISQTLSPFLHGIIYESLGIHKTYGAINIKKSSLSSFISSLRTGKRRHLAGINVTIPHKQDIIPFLDDIKDDALACGAVNTVVRRGEQLLGYNTDMGGLMIALEKMGKGFSGERVAILGTGGAALGAACKAAKESAAEITIVGRNRTAAAKIAKAAESCGNSKISMLYYDFSVDEKPPKGSVDIMINATPLGMPAFGKNFTDYNFMELLSPESTVFDMVYEPSETELVKEARRRGVRAETGIGMLIGQGLLSDELFLDTVLDKDMLYEAIKGKIGNDSNTK